MAARLKLAKLHVSKPQALIYHNVRGKLLTCPRSKKPQVRSKMTHGFMKHTHRPILISPCCNHSEPADWCSLHPTCILPRLLVYLQVKRRKWWRCCKREACTSKSFHYVHSHTSILTGPITIVAGTSRGRAITFPPSWTSGYSVGYVRGVQRSLLWSHTCGIHLKIPLRQEMRRKLNWRKAKKKKGRNK